jgi:transcriptional regulator with XRE-family HTH domain
VIRSRRESLGLPQEDVGDLHRNSLGKIERAEIAPTVLQLDRIATALGLSGSELLSEAEDLVQRGDVPDPPTRPGRRKTRRSSGDVSSDPPRR